jgi:hypothetical protein
VLFKTLWLAGTMGMARVIKLDRSKMMTSFIMTRVCRDRLAIA